MAINRARIGERIQELASKPHLTNQERVHHGLLRRLSNPLYRLGVLEHSDIHPNDVRAMLKRAEKVMVALERAPPKNMR